MQEKEIVVIPPAVLTGMFQLADDLLEIEVSTDTLEALRQRIAALDQGEVRDFYLRQIEIALT